MRVVQNFREAAHTDASDTDKMDMYGLTKINLIHFSDNHAFLFVCSVILIITVLLEFANFFQNPAAAKGPKSGRYKDRGVDISLPALF